MASSEDIAREFDGKAPVYEANRLAPWYIAHSDHLFEQLSLRPGDVVLDIGCGTGYLLRRIATTFPDVCGIGIDLAPRMIETACRKAAELELANLMFVQADWERQSTELLALLAAHPPNFMVCAHVLHYFAAPERALGAAYTVLAPGGRLLLLERALERSPLTAAWDYAHRFLIRDHVRFYGSPALLDMLERAGFREVEVRSKLSRYFWKAKMYTSLALISGLKH